MQRILSSPTENKTTQAEFLKKNSFAKNWTTSHTDKQPTHIQFIHYIYHTFSILAIFSCPGSSIPTLGFRDLRPFRHLISVMSGQKDKKTKLLKDKKESFIL